MSDTAIPLRELLPPRDDVPDHVYRAVLQLAQAARDVSIQHQLCTVCLIDTLAVMVEIAVDSGRVDHEGGETLQ